MAYAEESPWQHVRGIAPEELHAVERHELLRAAVTVVLPLEGDLAIGHVLYAPVADGHTVGVPGDVLQGVLHAAGGFLGIDDPLLREALLTFVLRQLHLRGERGHVLGTEHGRERPDGEEEGTGALAVPHPRQALPPSRLQVAPSCRDYAVQVGMERQLAAPGVQQGRHAQLYALFPGEGGQRVPRGAEQCGIALALVSQHPGVEGVGQREHHMHVVHGQQLLAAVLQPHLAPGSLADGAVAVAAAVPHGMHVAALGAGHLAPAHGLCAAVADAREHLPDVRHGTERLHIRRSEPAYGL